MSEDDRIVYRIATAKRPSLDAMQICPLAYFGSYLTSNFNAE